MSKKAITSLSDPPCGERPVPGSALIVGPGNTTSASQQLTGTGVADRAIDLRHLGAGIRDIVFGGGGRDGEADFANSAAAVKGITPTGGAGAYIYSFTKELSLSRVHVRSTVTLRNDGYRIACKELHLWGTAVIQMDGGAGSDATTRTGGVKGTTAGGGVILGSATAGGNGGAGGTNPNGNGSNGVAGSSLTGAAYGLGGNGGDSAAGQAEGGAAGLAGAAGTVQVADVSIYTLDNMTRLCRSVQAAFATISGGAGAGGAGGGGGGAASEGGGGGGAGSGGGVVLIIAEEIILHDWTGRISSNGGGGGAGVDIGAGSGGSAGGGGGGLCVIVTGKVTGGQLIAGPTERGVSVASRLFSANRTFVSGANVQANGGNGGQGGPSSVYDGYAGHSGTSAIINLGEPFIHVTERPQPAQARPFYPTKKLHAGHTSRKP